MQIYAHDHVEAHLISYPDLPRPRERVSVRVRVRLGLKQSEIWVRD